MVAALRSSSRTTCFLALLSLSHALHMLSPSPQLRRLAQPRMPQLRRLAQPRMADEPWSFIKPQQDDALDEPYDPEAEAAAAAAAAAEKAAKQRRIDAVNKAQATGADGLAGKAGVLFVTVSTAAFLAWAGDINNCAVLPAAKPDVCMVRSASSTTSLSSFEQTQ